MHKHVRTCKQGNSSDKAFQDSKKPKNRLALQSLQIEKEENLENEEIAKQLMETQCELFAKNIENEAFKKLQGQLKEMIKKLHRDNKAFSQEREVIKNEYVKLQDQLTIVRTEVSVFVSVVLVI